MKKLSLSIALITVITASSLISVQAAERPTSVATCKKSTAKPHVPAKLKQPKVPAKKIPTTLTLNTNCGTITATLFTKQAPQTTTNISTLANAKYFNGTLCHRLTTEGLFVLQCGDPTAQGGGSPGGWVGYKEENLPKAGAKNYPAGTLAMANSGPGTNGSQFFVVYADTQLDPDYTIFGKITSGLEIVKKIAEVGAYKVESDGQAYYAPDGFPIQLIAIERASAK
ncbi:MAG: peptidylprolyl isomerase [Candidatus Planktophila sp.]